ncbi:MAG: DUF3298 and DUF4163 domain-containing protein [Saprospiraceae bacterium]|nr:DUF3298 and DUF4163 domain-containing protein [Saprospiraceae bacterium]
MKKALVIIGFMAITVLGYYYLGNDNPFSLPARAPSAALLSFHMEHVNEKMGDCPTPDQRCLTVSMHYPVAEQGVDSVREKINNYTRALLLSTIHLGETPLPVTTPLDSALADFGEDYLDFLEEMPEYGMPWEVETEGKVILETSHLTSLEFSTYSFLGGAHPNSFVDLSTFNKETGAKLGLSDIVNDTTALQPILEEEFRKAREIGQESSLEEEGFWFTNNKVAYPANFAMVPDGFKLYYNPYEVGPYALGPTEFTIPLEKMVPFLKIQP